MKRFVLIATCLICFMAVFGCALNTAPTSGTGQAANTINNGDVHNVDNSIDNRSSVKKVRPSTSY